MDTVHDAIAWYQKKIGSYDKQLWEQSVEKKLQNAPYLHNAPRKSVRLKTEYIDVDLIRGSTFAKTKPQVPWVYITRKAVARVLFFPFYYNWWVHQTSWRMYFLLLGLYILQVVTITVYVRNVDHSILEDELSFTEVILPTILMFLLCLIHSQTVLAHITHKPPKRSKGISGVLRKPKAKKTTRKGHRSSGNNSSACPDDSAVDSGIRPKQHVPSPLSVPNATSSTEPPHTPTKATSNGLTQSVDRRGNTSLSTDRHGNTSLSPNRHGNTSLATTTTSSSDGLTQKASHGSPYKHGKGEVTSSSDGLTQRVPVESGKWSSSSSEKSAPLLTSERHSDVMLRSSKADGEGGRSIPPSQPNGQKCCPEKDKDKFSENSHTHGNIATTGSTCTVVDDPDHKSIAVSCQQTPNTSVVTCCNKSLCVTSSQCASGHEFKSHAVQVSDCSYNLLDNLPDMLRVEKVCWEEVGVDEKCRPEKPHACVQHGEERGDTPPVSGEWEDSGCDAESDVNRLESSMSPEDGVVEATNRVDRATSVDSYSGSSDFEILDHHQVLLSQSAQLPAGIDCSSVVSSVLSQNMQCEDNSQLVELSHIARGTSCGEQVCNDNVRDVSCHVLSAAAVAQEEKKTGNVRCASQATQTPPHSHTDQQHSLSSVPPPLPQPSVLSQSCDYDSSLCASAGVQHSLKHLSAIAPSSSAKTSNAHCQTTQTCAVSDMDHNASLSSLTNHTHPSPDHPASHHGPPTIPHILIREPSQQGGIGAAGTAGARNLSESSQQLQCFSDLFVQEILNEQTLRQMSCSSLLVHSDLENSSSSISHLSTASASSSTSASSSSGRHPPSVRALPTPPSSQPERGDEMAAVRGSRLSGRQQVISPLTSAKTFPEEDANALDESLDQINASDGERPSDVSNYNPSDSDPDSDDPAHEDLRNRCEEKRKRLRFQESLISSPPSTGTSKLSSSKPSGSSAPATSILTRKPSPLKEFVNARKSAGIVAAVHSSGSDQDPAADTRSSLRRRRRTSGTPVDATGEANSRSSRPISLGLRSQGAKSKHLSSSDNETGGAQTPEGSNKATMSSEEWEDRMHSDETTSSAYSSSCGNSDADSEERGEEEERNEYTTSTLHVINLLHPVRDDLWPGPGGGVQQGGSPTSSGSVSQPDKVSCVIWEGNECKKVDLTALDIGWAIIDKVDSLPESSDYFLIGLLFSFIMGLVPLVFRAFSSKDLTNWEELLTWPGLLLKVSTLSTIYSWRQNVVMINGLLQRFVLSLIFFFLLTVADRTFKQRLLYAKHFSYLTSSRRARKFTMPHFRLNKVRNIKIWLSLRSYLKRRGPQRSVDVIVSACFLCAISTVCLISLQMLKESDSYLDYLCNWELMVWCIALAVFLMRFMTIGLKINKKYRNLSVLITEQINLYLQMEQKPHKKEELILANNVLRLAEDLLKELESPFKISGFSANPLIYNIMRVVVLSAFSAVLTEVLGFKLKLHKIKLKG
ncbi:putative homeodomain transcription factor [Aplysia californica]|uniref:Homeodomain transcription factor n=1 Tax=Aplysia californica TaxID=6500 RepID=A0ABM1VX52_APLCA|nr:putative homeodomain transcription factor [Aplysia californica]